MFNGTFNSLDPHQLVALVSTLVPVEKSNVGAPSAFVCFPSHPPSIPRFLSVISLTLFQSLALCPLLSFSPIFSVYVCVRKRRVGGRGGLFVLVAFVPVAGMSVLQSSAFPAIKA